MLKILSMDPGKANYAYSVIYMKGPTKFRVVESGMIANTITDLTGEVGAATNKFAKEIRAIIRRHDIDLMVAERFQGRGLKGNLSELVNVMIGILMMLRPPLVLLTASQWKNSARRAGCVVDELYKLGKQYKPHMKPHVIDATSIGIYEGNRQFDNPAHFNFLKSKKNRQRYVESIHRAQIK